MGVIEIFGELCDTFGVCLGFELEAFAFEQSLELLVVGNDTVVNDSELPFRVRSVTSLACGRVELMWATYRWGWQLTVEGGP